MTVTTTIQRDSIRMEIAPDTELDGAIISHLTCCCRVEALPRLDDGSLSLLFTIAGKPAPADKEVVVDWDSLLRDGA